MCTVLNCRVHSWARWRGRIKVFQPDLIFSKRAGKLPILPGTLAYSVYTESVHWEQTLFLKMASSKSSKVMQTSLTAAVAVFAHPPALCVPPYDISLTCFRCLGPPYYSLIPCRVCSALHSDLPTVLVSSRYSAWRICSIFC